MSPTKRKSSPRPRSVTTSTDRPTLARFSADVDRRAKQAMGFVDTVRELYVARATLRHLQEARTEIFGQLTAAYDRGYRVIDGTGYELRCTQATEPVLYRAVDSAAAKKASPARWREAAATVPYVSVKAPLLLADQLAAAMNISVPVPDPGVIRNVASAVYIYKEHPVWTQIAPLRFTEIDLIGRLTLLADDPATRWDGMALAFSDGWTASVRRRQYSSERFAEVAPDLFERLAVTKVRQNSPHVYVVAAGSGDEVGIDLDGD